MASLQEIEQQISTTIGQQETSSGTAGVGATLNNPGALKYSDWEAQFGATAAPSGFAQFPTAAAGWDALKARVAQLVQGGSSLSSLINTWAPAADNNTNNPARIGQLAQQTGLNPSRPIATQIMTGGDPTMGSYGGDPTMSGNSNSLPETAAQSTDTGFTWGRVALFLVGVVCLIGGLMMFRQTQIVIEQATKTGARVAALAA